MKIAVLVVPYITNDTLYNYAKETIDSIHSERHEIYKVAVVNHCLDKYINLFDGFDIAITNDKNNLSRAWNTGIVKCLEELDADYILMPNLDIIFHKKCIDNMVILAEKTKSAGVLWTATEVWNKEDLKLNFNVEVITEAPKFECFLVNRETVEKIGFFDEQFEPAYFEDNDYHRRIRLAGYDAYATSKAKFFHYGSATINNDEKIKRENGTTFIKNREKYKTKWGGYVGQETFKKPYNK